jgi:hypothetical protein
MRPLVDVSVLAVALWVATEGEAVPTFNVDNHCKFVARAAQPVGKFDICMEDEKEARTQLMNRWTQFAPADKARCVSESTMGGDPTYTELLTCLEVATDARKL